MLYSAGLLMYRMKEGGAEVLLAHPGGPYFAGKDDGVWSLPKGEADDGEEGEEMLLEVAKREFSEETGFEARGPFAYLGAATRKDGKKIVHAWAFAGDADPSQARSNTITVDWPPARAGGSHSGRKIEVPEVDRVAFFGIATAKQKINPYQLGLIEAFERMMKN